MSDKIIRLESVSKVYQQGQISVTAVDKIDLEIEKGEYSILSGPSGSGKTTTLNMIGALDTPTSGEIFFGGQNLSGLSRAELSMLRRDHVGFVFQAYNLIATLTAFENAELVLSLQGVKESERKERVMAILTEVGLEGLADRRPDELSGGQQQRVAIARAVAHNPAIVLADEPTANVDSANADALLDLMERLNKEKNVTFLFSSHDPRVIKRGRRIITMRDGVIESDTVKEA